MAEFTPKTSEEILRDAINYLYTNTNVSDFNVGSVIRTILEVMSIEDAEQYFQMYSILQAFFLKNASGAALDDRGAQYDVARVPATSSVGEVVFLDTNLKRSFLIQDLSVGDPVLYVADASQFPAPPFIVKLGESASVEQVSISAVSITANSLTVNPGAPAPLNAVTYDHSSASAGVDEVDNISSLVCHVNPAEAPRIIPTGITLKAQPTNVTFSIECITTEVSTQKVGYFASDAVRVKSSTVGTDSNVPSKRLNQIVGGSPYSGAAVINKAAISGGANAENDAAFRERIRNKIAGLSAGTVTAIVDGLLQVVDSTTNQIITRARVVEDFDKKTVWAYIDDASASFLIDESRFSEDTLSLASIPGTLTLHNLDDFSVATLSNRKHIIIDPSGANPFVTTYDTRNTIAPPTLSTLSPTLGMVYPIGTVVTECEPLTLQSEDSRKYYFLNTYPVGDDQLKLYRSAGVGAPPGLGDATLLKELLPGASKTYDPATGALIEDYLLNKATGQIEFFDDKIPATGSALFAVYENYINLIKSAQTKIDGDPEDRIAFPGIRSAGVKVLVRPAKRTAVDVTVDLTINSDQTDINTASFLTKQLIITYVNNLDIGEDVIIAEIIDRAMSVSGVTNCKVVTPADDRVVNHDEVAYASDIVII